LYYASRSGHVRGEKGIVATPIDDIIELERSLLRGGLGALTAERSRCARCGRTPLTGEHVHLYEDAPRLTRPRKRLLCELCRLERSDAPVASELVRSCEHALAVRLTAHAA
jgi:hypothetical protein